MSYIRKVIRKNKNGSVKTYYEEVQSIRIGKKVVQHHIRSLGTDPEVPTNIKISSIHFGYIATRIMQGDLTANELLDMLQQMGYKVARKELERIGIHYDLKKKLLTLYLCYAKK